MAHSLDLAGPAGSKSAVRTSHRDLGVSAKGGESPAGSAAAPEACNKCRWAKGGTAVRGNNTGGPVPRSLQCRDTKRRASWGGVMRR